MSINFNKYQAVKLEFFLETINHMIRQYLTEIQDESINKMDDKKYGDDVVNAFISIVSKITSLDSYIDTLLNETKSLVDTPSLQSSPKLDMSDK